MAGSSATSEAGDAGKCFVCLHDDPELGEAPLAGICDCTMVVHRACLEQLLNSEQRRAMALEPRLKCAVCQAKYRACIEKQSSPDDEQPMGRSARFVHELCRCLVGDRRTVVPGLMLMLSAAVLVGTLGESRISFMLGVAIFAFGALSVLEVAWVSRRRPPVPTDEGELHPHLLVRAGAPSPPAAAEAAERGADSAQGDDVPATPATPLPNPSPSADAPVAAGAKGKEQRAAPASRPARERVAPSALTPRHSADKRRAERGGGRGKHGAADTPAAGNALLPPTDGAKAGGRAATVASTPIRELTTPAKHAAAAAAEAPSIGTRTPTC